MIENLDDEPEWEVWEPESWENKTGPKGWWAVANYNGIKAYFGEESDAWEFCDLKNKQNRKELLEKMLVDCNINEGVNADVK